MDFYLIDSEYNLQICYWTLRCIDFAITSPLLVESNFSCSHWGCTCKFDHRGESCPWMNMEIHVIFQLIHRTRLSLKICSSIQPVPHDNQNNIPIFLSSITPCWPPQRAASFFFPYLWKTDLLVYTMITTQRLLRSIVFLAPCPRSRVWIRGGSWLAVEVVRPLLIAPIHNISLSLPDSIYLFAICLSRTPFVAEAIYTHSAFKQHLFQQIRAHRQASWTIFLSNSLWLTLL